MAKEFKSVEKLEIGKDYINVHNNSVIVIDRTEGMSNRGFTYDLYQNYLNCSNHSNWREATESEVIEAFKRHLVHRYGEDWETMMIKEKHPDLSSAIGINNGLWNVKIVKQKYGWTVWNKNGLLYRNGIWVERLEEDEKNKIMKKYRLKQWYPRIPVYLEDGCVISFDDNTGIATYTFKNGATHFFEMSGAELECTQYWELIEEKEPLFITEDGVEITDGMQSVIAIDSDINVEHTRYQWANKKDLIFAHESNAEEYILWNKPLFSLQDIDATIKGHLPEFDDMKKLAEERIEKL